MAVGHSPCCAECKYLDDRIFSLVDSGIGIVMDGERSPLGVVVDKREIRVCQIPNTGWSPVRPFCGLRELNLNEKVGLQLMCDLFDNGEKN